MSEPQLIGVWSDAYLSVGSMEATDLIFTVAGVGWSVLSTAAGCEQILFHWSVPEHGRLVLREERYARFEGHLESQVLVDEHGWDETIETAFIIRPGRDVGGNPATLLELDERISFGDQFQLIRREPEARDDPAGWTQPR
ncbi:hypothetical protein [Amycolatopsis taiwanensis]|uniref:hypothetical protein n=1 Tax=Amycolatopsis taiwanensis TaxID=342230 RepID=UPI000487E65E|nr:hypothetical protein [Amycolatopsis taiwanensis]